MKKFLDYSSGQPAPEAQPSRIKRELVIAPLGQRKRWVRFATYLLGYALVASALGWLFIQFTGSIRLAIVLVGFMLLYMTAMTLLAERNLKRRE